MTVPPTSDVQLPIDEGPVDIHQLLETPSPTRETIHQIFTPYRRISPPWSAYEYFKTIVVVLFILPVRILYACFAGLILFLVVCLALLALPKSKADINTSTSVEGSVDYDQDILFKPLSPWRRFLVSLIFPIMRSILFISFGVYHIKREYVPFSSQTAQRLSQKEDAHAYVIVANHLGYIDILILMTVFRGSFVAKGECEFTPLVGLIARALQCMFVRQGQSLTTQLIHRVRSTHECHEKRQKKCPGCRACMSSLVVFPEGTTTNGTSMVPFRTGVFNAGLPVKLVCIRFPHRHFNMSWETIRFREHLFRTMTQFQNYVHLTELPVYTPSVEETSDSRLFAINVQTEMANVLQQDIIPLNRKHKLLYHSYLLGKVKNESDVVREANTLLNDDTQLNYFINSQQTDM